MIFGEKESRDGWPSDVRFEKPTSKCEQQMLDFVNEHFVPFEPLNVAIDLCPPGYRYSRDSQ